MYYLELIQRFWEFNQKTQLNPTIIATYLYLLNLANENKGYDITVSDVTISKILRITRKTVKASKERLRELGLIKYENANGFPCTYRLILNYPLQVQENKNERKAKTKDALQILVTENMNHLELHHLPVKSTIQNPNLKDEILHIHSPRHSIHIVDIPSLEEFMKYAKSLKDYDPELDLSLTRKYENWVNNGWKNTSNRPIRNWKSTLKSTLPYLKNSNEEHFISLQDIPNIKRPES